MQRAMCSEEATSFDRHRTQQYPGEPMGPSAPQAPPLCRHSPFSWRGTAPGVRHHDEVSLGPALPASVPVSELDVAAPQADASDRMPMLATIAKAFELMATA
jgi:hypothetical protein